MVRILYAGFFLLYGILLLLPFNSFGNGNIYFYMSQIASEEAWAAWFLWLGGICLYRIVTNVRGSSKWLLGKISFLLGTATMVYMTVTPFISAMQKGFIPAAVADYVVICGLFIWCAVTSPWPKGKCSGTNHKPLGIT